MTDYQTVAQKIKEFMTFKAQIGQMQSELEELKNNPPNLHKDILTWEEAVAFAESEEQHKARLKELEIGIQNRYSIIQSREKEVGEMLPIQERYILFKLDINGEIETYKIGYFPKSYGFRMEKHEEGV